MIQYNVKSEMRTDMSTKETDPIPVGINPRLAGKFQVWGWSMNCWEIDVFHEPPEEKTLHEGDKSWTILDARDDTIIEYNWWFECYRKMILDRVGSGDMTLVSNDKKTDRRIRFDYLVEETDEPIRFTLTPVDGLSNARWNYRTDIEDLANMKNPPSKQVWIEEILWMHNEIVSELQAEWDKVKQFY